VSCHGPTKDQEKKERTYYGQMIQLLHKQGPEKGKVKRFAQEKERGGVSGGL